MSIAAERERASLIARWPDRPLARSATLAELRRNAEIEYGRVPLPDGCTVEPLDKAGVTGERIVPQGLDGPGAILYHHGGGHVFCSSSTHRHLVANLAEAAGLIAYNMDYSLAPERPFPAGVEDAVRNYRFALNEGVQPERLIVAGDSAGGNLTAAMLLRLAREGLPRPAGAYLISPWLDLRPRTVPPEERPHRDPLLPPESVTIWAKLYHGRNNPADPDISPVLADLTGFPPTLIQVGGAELLLDDSLTFARNLALSGAEVQLNVWKDQLHAWPLFLHELPSDGQGAVAQGGAWIRALLGKAS